MTPLLTIIIPFYNAEKTLARALASLLQMPENSRSSAEAVLVDDGSTDRSREIAEAQVGACCP